MKAKIKFLIKYSLLFGLIGFIYLIGIPKAYDVPKLEALNTTKFWNLSTGSKIGYTLINSSSLKKAPPIIYLHGGPGSCISKKNIQSLTPLSKEGHDIYCYDQVGGGRSGRLKNIAEYTVNRHIEDLEEIIQQIGASKVILIAQSWGAILATILVSKHPHLVEKIILTGPGPILPIKRNLPLQKAPDSLKFIQPIFTNRDGNKKSYNLRTKFIRWWAYTFESKFAKDSEVDDFFTYLNKSLNRSTVCDTSLIPETTGGGGYYAHIMTLNSFEEVIDPRPQIKDLKTPLLIMKGQCGNQKWEFVQEYLTLFQNSKLVFIPNAGHSIATEQQELYIKTILQFLEEKN